MVGTARGTVAAAFLRRPASHPIDRYMRDYGVLLLQPLALRWMRHFHTSASATLVPTEALRDAELKSMASCVCFRGFSARSTARNLSRASQRSVGVLGLRAEDLAVIHPTDRAGEKSRLAVRTFREIQKQCSAARFV